MEVECLRCQCRMKLTRFTVQAWSVIIKNPIGYIRRLLHLCQKDTPTDGMHTSSWQIKHIPRLHLMIGQYLRDGAIGNALLVFFCRDLLTETRIEMGTLISLDDIPHLRLAHFPMFAHRHLIVGMHLDTQIFLSINKLHQQRQLTMVFPVHSLAQDRLWHFFDHRHQIQTLPDTIADNTRTGGHGTHLPTLTNRFVGRF